MGKKMLGKVVAGAALGGASLLLFSPGMANAAGHAYVGNTAATPQVSLLTDDQSDMDQNDQDRDNHDGKDRDRDHKNDRDNNNHDGKDRDRDRDRDHRCDDGKNRDRDNKDRDGKDRDRDHCFPKGHVDGGDGGMTTTSVDRNMAASGVGVIGAAALGGMVLLRRRRANGLG